MGYPFEETGVDQPDGQFGLGLSGLSFSGEPLDDFGRLKQTLQSIQDASEVKIDASKGKKVPVAQRVALAISEAIRGYLTASGKNAPPSAIPYVVERQQQEREDEIRAIQAQAQRESQLEMMKFEKEFQENLTRAKSDAAFRDSVVKAAIDGGESIYTPEGKPIPLDVLVRNVTHRNQLERDSIQRSRETQTRVAENREERLQSQLEQRPLEKKFWGMLRNGVPGQWTVGELAELNFTPEEYVDTLNTIRNDLGMKAIAQRTQQEIREVDLEGKKKETKTKETPEEASARKAREKAEAKLIEARQTYEGDLLAFEPAIRQAYQDKQAGRRTFGASNYDDLVTMMASGLVAGGMSREEALKQVKEDFEKILGK